MKRVGFVLKREKPEAEHIARELVPFLMERGLTVAFGPQQERLAATLPGVAVVTDEDMGAAVDLLIVLGGDGTLLHAASLLADGAGAVPILGINLGTLGFIVPFAPADARVAVERALAGELALEDRMRLLVRHHHEDTVSERLALNDAVIAQGSLARLIELAASLDGQRIALYRADGLIVCTPTGSTGYNLAAGGPILSPGQSSVAVTPICPHTLTHRPLVVPSSSHITVDLPGRPDGASGIMLTVDGQRTSPLVSGDRVVISAAAAPLRIYRSDKPYFEILREKLSWGWRAGEST